MPSVRLGRHEAKDGDVLMHACQKITAQLFSARSHTDMAVEHPTRVIMLMFYYQLGATLLALWLVFAGFTCTDIPAAWIHPSIHPSAPDRTGPHRTAPDRAGGALLLGGQLPDPLPGQDSFLLRSQYTVTALRSRWTTYSH
ncbi:hypothetical protein F2P81_007741 [Scophthalmus maximus]|uniref:Uncharacterized protein n=1 Tax=Scophthalmus maximus TaxID=52904 RepID=A0A6A4SW83_SCOMX|nr:hypothetical protein F2P81_007741 [Scophthalmus maximus]